MDNPEVKKQEYYNLYDDIINLQNDKKTLSVPKLKKKYKHIQIEYPDIFNKVLRKDLNNQELILLKTILDEREKLRHNETNLSDSFKKIFKSGILEN